MPATHLHEPAPAPRRSPMPFGRSCLFALAAWFLAAAPVGAQTLNYVDHLNVDFAHDTVLQTNIALGYHDRYGDLQGPPTGARNGNNFFDFYTTKELNRLRYIPSELPSWDGVTLRFGADLAFGAGTEVSYTPIQTGRPPPTNGPFTVYEQHAIMTGARNALYTFHLVSQNRTGLVTVHGDSPLPPYPPYIPGNALLTTSERSAILTTGDGVISTVDPSGQDGQEGQLTPLISARGSGPGELNNPSALAIGPDGLLYVLDAGNNRIQKFNATTGAYQGGFALPEGMTVYTQLLQTTLNPETGAQEIVYDGEGKPVYNNTGGNVFSSSIAISAEGHIYLGDGAGGGFVFDLNGNLLTTFHPPEEDASWVDGGLIGGLTLQNFGVGSYLNYDGMGNVFTYVEGKGIFMYRDPTFDALDYVNLTVGGNQPTAVTSGPGVSVLGSLSFRNDLSETPGTLTIVDPVTVRTGNIYVQHDEWGRDSTGIINGGTLLTAGDMHKINGGTLILNNVNTYTGRTIVDDGKLIVNGSIAGDAVVTDNATLGGHGVIGGNVLVENGGTLSPGNSPGLLTIEGDLTLSELSTLLMEFGGTGEGLFDQLAVLGLFNADGTLSLQILDGYTPVYGDSFQLFTEGGFDFGNFTNISTNLGDGLEWDTSHLADDGKVTVVPEPSTYALLGLGLGALYFCVQGRRRGPSRHPSLAGSHPALPDPL